MSPEEARCLTLRQFRCLIRQSEGAQQSEMWRAGAICSTIWNTAGMMDENENAVYREPADFFPLLPKAKQPRKRTNGKNFQERMFAMLTGKSFKEFADGSKTAQP